MNHSELLRSVTPDKVTGTPSSDITGITPDSRKVKNGTLFIAIPGTVQDGADFIPSALERGASGVVVKTGTETSAPFVVEVSNPRATMADLAAKFYGRPADKLTNIGVTGSDGKTTTSHIIRHLLLLSDYQVAIMNTVYVATQLNEQKNPYSLTTPDSPDVQQFLANFVAHSDPTLPRAAVLEASSHAIDLDRLRAIGFKAGVFTNLIPTHLEYHPTFDDYRRTKARLFSGLNSDSSFAVINEDDPNAGYFRQASPAPVISYGIENNCEVQGEIIKSTAAGSEFIVHINGRDYKTSTPLQGIFNVSNTLAGVSVAYGLGLDMEQLISRIPEIGPVSGRMMEIDAGQPFRVVIDFAHTPGALRTVVDSLKKQKPNRLGVVIGHAGDRDLNNRPELARAATDAEMIFITMDDPGSEDPVEIAKVMAQALSDDGKKLDEDFQVIVDRRSAMEQAFLWAKPNDLVLIAGRGHEQEIPWGDKNIPFDDTVVTKELLADMGYQG